ncbi:short-chain dehydrogenase/reductase [Gymnopus androsaceus JB14]|uniref:Short-chain dehydrogenase/reductase n=1 Tax=Gymnopus androsaceus JB14 TaxID=1447944 RepID=A0A6A4HCL9_9AGAR|nr:short-chain dehydrogenase/reductase [Gymnopus androsaceus JB14]
MSVSLKLTPTYHRDTYPSISPTKPSLTQTGKTILITGGGGGLGFEIARSFAKASASRIIVVGRRAGFLDEAVGKLRDEFQSGGTEFMAHQADIGSDTSIASLWEFLHSQSILIHVLVLNATHFSHNPPDTLSLAKSELMDAFNVNVGGNFLMAAKFVKQALRPAGLQLFLINVSTLAIHTPVPMITSYGVSKAAFTGLVGRIANDRPVEDVQIISFHPGTLYSEGASKFLDKDAFDWDEFALPADFSVWAASSEAAWLHGRFVWAHWDIDELKSDPEVLKRFEEEKGYLTVGVQGLTAATIEPMFDRTDAKKN